jgi:hypothetical protein
VQALDGRGLEGDRAAGGKRQVTLLKGEHLAVLASMTSALEVRPEQTPRNLLVTRMNVLALVSCALRSVKSWCWWAPARARRVKGWMRV